MNAYSWYLELAKPSWAPPAELFGPVWTILYVLIAVSFGVVFYKAFKSKISWLVALPFILNLFFNLIFTPIQFGLRNNLLASIDIILVLITLIWAMVAIYPYARWITYIQMPYLLWVAFATVLQLSITYLNASPQFRENLTSLISFQKSAPFNFSDELAAEQIVSQLAIVPIEPIEEGADLESIDFSGLTATASQASWVLLGEASHGTSQYYTARAAISRDLIENHGFSFILVEGDWDALDRVNSYIWHQLDESVTARDVLRTFDRWPEWMWANQEFLQLVEWLHQHNADLPPEKRVGLHGKDVYGLTDSMLTVIAYTRGIDENITNQVGEAYDCLWPYRDDFQEYARSLATAGIESCQDEVAQAKQLVVDLVDDSTNFTAFRARQSALAVVHGERYYRSLIQPGATSWNNRVDYMHLTANRLHEYYTNHLGDSARGIIWAHNTHIGDARATEMREAGMYNIGQLLREQLGEQAVYSIGFGTYTGEVVAGRFWGSSPTLMSIPQAHSDSYEWLLNHHSASNFKMNLDDPTNIQALSSPRPHRAKGVVYNPNDERGNYVLTDLPKRYNHFIFFTETNALSPLD